MTKVIIAGAKGRMGRMLLDRATHIPEIKIVGAVDQGDDVTQCIGDCDVVIDFSLHEATLGFAELCAKHQKALVIGTTGHNEAEKAALRAFQSAIPMVWTSN